MSHQGTASLEPRGISHVVVLGAGASVAAFPGGDPEGRTLPSMLNLIDVVGLSDVIQAARQPITTTNFEELYGAMFAREPNSAELREVESRVYGYFDSLYLPIRVTLYDRLLLSLRCKDVVATFNWDPFLFDSYVRLSNLIGEERLPLILHLHGNVRLGYCAEHLDKGEKGDVRSVCSVCNKRFSPTRLLYPVRAKNYNDDAFLKAEWDFMRRCLARCFTLTVFGYGAPKSDLEAVELLQSAWKDRSSREVENVEIIDIKSEEELAVTWSGFTFSHHWQVRTRFEDSFIGTHPRRSAERVWMPTIEGRPIVGTQRIPDDIEDLDELVQSVRHLFDEEEEEIQKYWEARGRLGR